MQIHRKVFEHWLFSQSDEREFIYDDTTDCAFCTFVKETTNKREVHCGAILFGLEKTKQSTFPIPQFILPLLSVEPLRIKEMKAKYITLFGNPNPEPVKGENEQNESISTTLHLQKK